VKKYNPIHILSNSGKGGGAGRENILGSPLEQMGQKMSGGGRNKCGMAPKTRGHAEF